MGLRESRLDHTPKMRGFFGVGCYGISKAANVGAIFRTAHAFGGSFVCTINAAYEQKHTKLTDTSAAISSMPFYAFPSIEKMLLPEQCKIVAVELTDDAVDLPSFHHPSKCMYLFGPERGNVPDALLEQSDHIVKIPTKFCVNVSLAAGLILYDRMLSLGRYAPRAVYQKPRNIKRTVQTLDSEEFTQQAQQYMRNAPDEINK